MIAFSVLNSPYGQPCHYGLLLVNRPNVHVREFTKVKYSCRFTSPPCCESTDCRGCIKPLPENVAVLNGWYEWVFIPAKISRNRTPSHNIIASICNERSTEMSELCPPTSQYRDESYMGLR